ncbi:hypothetical protein [Desulfoferrobacter suflitae]|uniref:hypothetical protein n=1 Tax=Desulfoferrobacter suflitae TaxID=2865782 RepID=UPI0021645138|nr:hypothetical protein [Desulfoferrobacter suflitae]MCK8601983.1 hypothetical protein [Desulfoferrobacter suflitae]
MDEVIDVIELVNDLKSRPRGRACVVLSHDYGGQKEWAGKLAGLTGSQHLDLLELFAADPNLSGRMAEFSVSKLFDFLKNGSKSPVLIVSGVEFLKATWSGQSHAAQEFARRLETSNQKPALLFVMQYDKAIAGYQFRRHSQYPFAVDQKETFAIS